MLAIQSPYPQFPDLLGKPLQAGKAFFGVAFGNPLTAPVDIFWDAGGTQPALQPVRTVNGMMVRAGTPANVFCTGDFSILLQDSAGEQVFYAPSAAELNGNLALQLALSALTGAGLSGFDFSISYAPGTLGYAVSRGDTVQYRTNVAVLDDAIGLANLAAANPFKRIMVERGVTLNFYSECVITSSSVLIDLNGGSIVQHTPDINSLTFMPASAGTSAAFLDECGIANGTISHSNVTASTVGWALNLVQCNGFRARDMRFNNGDVAVYGGQFNSFSGCKFFASSGAYKGTGSALLHLIDAPLPAGAYQRPLTFMLDNPFMAASQLRDACVRVHSADGFTITSGYVNFALNANVLFLSDHANTVISNIALNGLYNDCVRQAGGTKCGVEIRDDSDPTSTVYSVQIDGGWIGNGSLSGILSRKPETQSISVNGVLVENFTAWGFDHQGGTLVDVQLNACRFLSCGTNGASGDVRLQGGSSYNLAGNTHRFSANVCVSRSGNWVTGSIGDCHNVSGAAADTVTTETLTNPIVMNGNTSNYGGIVNSWKGGQETYLAYASNALAVAAGLQVGRLYRNGDNLCVVH